MNADGEAMGGRRRRASQVRGWEHQGMVEEGRREGAKGERAMGRWRDGRKRGDLRRGGIGLTVRGRRTRRCDWLRVAGGVGEAGFGEAFLAQQAGVAVAAGEAGGGGVVAAMSEGVIDA